VKSSPAAALGDAAAAADAALAAAAMPFSNLASAAANTASTLSA
jgi:hypothetical protein